MSLKSHTIPYRSSIPYVYPQYLPQIVQKIFKRNLSQLSSTKSFRCSSFGCSLASPRKLHLHRVVIFPRLWWKRCLFCILMRRIILQTVVRLWVWLVTVLYGSFALFVVPELIKFDNMVSFARERLLSLPRSPKTFLFALWLSNKNGLLAGEACNPAKYYYEISFVLPETHGIPFQWLFVLTNRRVW